MSTSVHDNQFDIHANSLLAATFGHPSEVLSSDILSIQEKRCVLAAWASDAFAVEGKPWLRQLPGSFAPVPVALILRYLTQLDEDDDPPPRRGGGALGFPLLEKPKMAVGF
jgi:hypothetical protein